MEIVIRSMDYGPVRQCEAPGSFPSVRELTRKINAFVEQYNPQASPFAKVATAESIFAKNERLCSLISGTRH